MVLSKADVVKYNGRVLRSRNRLLQTNSFYGMLLMHMRFFLDEECETAYTDGERIAFSPAFMDKLTDSELDFVLMHEILHVVLEHCFRVGDRDNFLFNCASDIVVNSNIRLSNGDDPLSITIAAFGESMNIAPNGKPGHLYTAEEVYEMFPRSERDKASGGSGKGNGTSSSGSGDGNGSSQGKKGSGSAKKEGGEEGDASQANCGKESKSGTGGAAGGKGQKGLSGTRWDDHSHWKEDDGDSQLSDTWRARVAAAAATVLSIEEASDGCGSVPLGVDRLLKERHRSQVDWRTLLHEFVQEEICDWSFSPPDHRFPDSPFFLPDFNGTVENVRNILFMADTSGSISDDMLSHAYSELLAVIEQYDGAFEGFLGFFDAEVYEPVPFSTVEDLAEIRPKGGGGTSFHAVFDHVRKWTEEKEEPPACLIMLTDGYAAFPDEEATGGVPVLWLINNEDVTPPYGKVARIKI